MAGDDGYLIRIVHCQVGIYEDEDVGYCFREGESRGEECPGVGICVEDND
jgi:hypothetical protein